MKKVLATIALMTIGFNVQAASKKQFKNKIKVLKKEVKVLKKEVKVLKKENGELKSTLFTKDIVISGLNQTIDVLQSPGTISQINEFQAILNASVHGCEVFEGGYYGFSINKENVRCHIVTVSNESENEDRVKGFTLKTNGVDNVSAASTKGQKLRLDATLLPGGESVEVSSKDAGSSPSESFVLSLDGEILEGPESKIGQNILESGDIRAEVLKIMLEQLSNL